MRETLDGALSEVVEAVPRLRGVLHQVAFGVSLVAGAVLVAAAEGARETAAVAVYAVAAALLFGTSAAYHRGSWSPRASALMQRLDHSMIFVLIAGTYTPFTVLLLDGATRWVVFGIAWVGALVGVLARNLLRRRGVWLFTGLYLVLGWVGIAVVPTLLRVGGPVVLGALLLGGVLYSLGAVVYARQRPDPSPRWFGYHEVFHALTVAAFAAHYVAVAAATSATPAA